MSQIDFISTIKARGFLHQCTDEAGLGTLLASAQNVPAYIGFDCTAKSLHVGSLLQIMLLRWWQKSGNKPIVLMGGGTTKVGDPTGRDESRPQLTDALIAENMAGIKQVFTKFLSFGEGAGDAIMLDNDDWLSKLTMPFVFGVLGPLISVNKMLAKDSIKQRLERQQHLSYLEFNYMVLQAYDFVKLYEDYGCRVQMGGSDQWGNITAGIDLHQKMQESKKVATKEDVFGMTSPLVTTAAGTKMGKTAGGAVWLNADMTSPYDYWQFWRNTEDADVGKFLRLFTELELEHIATLEALEGAEINEAKKILATEATAMLHGREEAERAAQTARETFEKGGTSADLPEVMIADVELVTGMPVYMLLVKAGLAASNGDARRLIKGGGARVNDRVVEQDSMLISKALLTPEGYIKVSSGKKKHVLVRPA